MQLLTRISAVSFLFAVVLLQGCATLQHPDRFTSGRPKNSLPFFAKERLEESRTLLVPAFLGDLDGWRDMSVDVLGRSSAIDLVSGEKTAHAMRSSGRDLSSLSIDERPAVLLSACRAVRSDAVLNGLILINGDENELILQLISCRDGRILWWQAVEFSGRAAPDSETQRRVVSELLQPLLDRLGKRSGPSHLQETPPERGFTQPSPSEQKGPADPQKEKRQQPRKPDSAPPARTDDISPM